MAVKRKKQTEAKDFTQSTEVGLYLGHFVTGLQEPIIQPTPPTWLRSLIVNAACTSADIRKALQEASFYIYYSSVNQSHTRQLWEDLVGDFIHAPTTGHHRVKWFNRQRYFVQGFLWTLGSYQSLVATGHQEMYAHDVTTSIASQPVQITVLHHWFHEISRIITPVSIHLPRQADSCETLNVKTHSDQSRPAPAIDQALALMKSQQTQLQTSLPYDLAQAVMVITKELLRLRSRKLDVFQPDPVVVALSIPQFFAYFDTVYAEPDASRGKLREQFQAWLTAHAGKSLGSKEAHREFASGVQVRANQLRLRFECPGKRGETCGVPASFRWMENRTMDFGAFYFTHSSVTPSGKTSGRKAPQSKKYLDKHGSCGAVPRLVLVTPAPDRRRKS
jgi:hypothetical protein